MEQLIESKIDLFLESISSPLYIFGIVLGIIFIGYASYSIFKAKKGFKFSTLAFLLVGLVSIVSSFLQLKYQ